MIIIEEGINKKDLMLQFNSFEFYDHVAGNLHCIWSLASSHNHRRTLHNKCMSYSIIKSNLLSCFMQEVLNRSCYLSQREHKSGNKASNIRVPCLL